MANYRVTKADRILNKLAASKVCSLTEAGSNYIRERYDPYHDNPFKPSGYPDQYNGVSVTRVVKKSITVSQTTGGAVATEAPWDLHVFATPLLNTDQSFLATQPGASGGINSFQVPDISAAGSPAYGGIMIQGNTQAGTDFQYMQAATTTQTVLGRLAPSKNDLSNNMRVIAAGYEIIDGTAALYRQGILTCYRQNQPNSTDIFAKGGSQLPPSSNIYAEYPALFRRFKLPPLQSGAALLIPDSKQWKVEEGAYVSLDFHSDEIPMALPECIFPAATPDINLIEQTDTQPFFFVAKPNYSIQRDIPGTSPQAQTATYGTWAQKWVPWNNTGCFLNGLHPLASITINAIFYLECAPDGEDEELLTLASQSPADDPMARAIVSSLRAESPVAVKLKENYLGEWFVNGITDFVKTVTPWVDNARVVADQVVNWGDQLRKNDGVLINPQSFVRGNVSKKIAKENIQKGLVPKAPGPAPAKRAFNPKPITHVNGSAYDAALTERKPGTKRRRRIRAYDDTEEARRQRDRAIAQKAARGWYDSKAPVILRRKL